MRKKFRATIQFGDEIMPIMIKADSEMDARRQLVTTYRVKNEQILGVKDKSTIKNDQSYYKSSFYGRSSIINGRSSKRGYKG